MPIKLLIIDGQPIFADALAAIIRNALSDVRIVRASNLNDGKAAIYREIAFDLVLLDLWLPDSRGLEGLIELRGLFPRVPIVIVSAFAEQSVVRRAIVCGAAGFIPKSISGPTFLRALKDVLSGDVDLALDDLACTFTLPTRQHKRLTHQQLRVLQMLCSGLPNKLIAYRLGLQQTTVKSHLTRIMQKLGVRSRTQAVLEVSKSDASILGFPEDENASSFDHACIRDDG